MGQKIKMYSIIYKEGFTAQDIPQETRNFMDGKTYHENPHIGFDDLALLKMNYYDFEHKVQTGEMIASKKLAREVLEIFSQLFDEDNNSSAFNYRVVADTNSISMHSYGRAIDINPLINPYIVGEKVMPANAMQYCDRELAFSHKIDHNDAAYRIFKAHGWEWGGDWTNTKDYQHFVKPFRKPLKTTIRRLKNLMK